MSSTFGSKIKLTVFGESHSAAIGMTLEGVPAGERIDLDELQRFMERRAPGRDRRSTPRREADVPEFLSGLRIEENVGKDPDDGENDASGSTDEDGDRSGRCPERYGITTGTPISAIIRNSNTRSSDYEVMKEVPRPGHADYPAHVKYKGYEDYRGGGHFSGRLTAPICIAGGIILQILRRSGITVKARIDEIRGVKITPDDYDLHAAGAGNAAGNSSSAGDMAADMAKECDAAADTYELAMAEIDRARAQGDSVGGIVSCEISGLPVGLGEPMFGGVENVISQAVFAIPAVKGIEFGRGFDAARIMGSENNDPFVPASYAEDGQAAGYGISKTAADDGEDHCAGSGIRIMTDGNKHGGILGGLTSGMPVTFRAAFKPTPSIAKPQKSVSYRTGEAVELAIKGRHDPCVVVRAVPVVEAAAAIAIYDLF